MNDELRKVEVPKASWNRLYSLLHYFNTKNKFMLMMESLKILFEQGYVEKQFCMKLKLFSFTVNVSQWLAITMTK